MIGLTLAVLAIAGSALGIDQDRIWGGSRIFLLYLGVLTLGLVLIPVALRRATGALSSVRSITVIRGPAQWWSMASEALSMIGHRPAAASAFAGAGMLLVALTYWFLVTLGYWTQWAPTTRLYDLLGEAFLHGQLHLRADPPPDLSALSDPYNPQARGSLRVLWDTSFYQGRYYLYWGPVPALIAGGSRLLGVPLGDAEIGLLFLLGLIGLLGVLLREIWGNHFRDIPSWNVGLGVAVIGLTNPLPWLLNPLAIYEAAIIGGQLYLVAGLYAAYRALCTSTAGGRWFILAGFLWACAIGTRASLAPAAVFLTVLLTVEILQRHRARRQLGKAWGLAAHLWAPFAFGLLVLGLYNVLRFGQVWEMGHRYQLTSVNLNRVYGQAISVDNLPANLHNYLLNPVRTLPVFPFVKPRWGGTYFWPFYRLIVTPDVHDSEQVTGLLLAFPFGVFAFASLPWMVGGPARGGAGSQGTDQGSQPVPTRILVWLIRSSVGALVLAFVPILLYLVTSMRYMGDVMPLLSLVSVLGHWTAYRTLRDRGDDFAVLRAVSWALIGVSISMGLLLGVTGYNARFETFNPDLFHKITRLLAW